MRLCTQRCRQRPWRHLILERHFWSYSPTVESARIRDGRVLQFVAIPALQVPLAGIMRYVDWAVAGLGGWAPGWGRYGADACGSGAPIRFELLGVVPCRACLGPRVCDGEFVEAVEVAGVAGDHGHVVVEGGGGDECVSKGSRLGYVQHRCLAGDLGIDW